MSDFERQLRTMVSDYADTAEPSPSAWAQIVDRLDDPREGDVAVAPNDVDLDLEDLMGDERPAWNRRSRYLVLAAAILLVAVGAVAAIRRSGNTTESTDPVDQTVEAEETTTTSAPPDADPDGTPALEAPTEPPPPISLTAEPLPVLLAGGPTLSGDYQADALGTPLQFTLSEDMQLVSYRPGELYLTSTTSSLNRGLLVARISGLFTAEQSDGPGPGVVGEVQPLDIERWLTESHYTAERLEPTTVGGYPARVVDVLLNGSAPYLEAACGRDTRLTPCRHIYSPSSDLLDRNTEVFGRTLSCSFVFSQKIRLWIVDFLDDGEPLLIAADSLEGEFDSLFFEQADQFVASLEFGEVAPLIVPTEHEQTVAESLPEAETRQLAELIIDAALDDDPATIAEALGPDGVWVDDAGNEYRGSTEIGRALKRILWVPLGDIQLGPALPVVGGYFFPTGAVQQGGWSPPVAMIITIDDAGVVRAGFSTDLVEAER